LPGILGALSVIVAIVYHALTSVLILRQAIPASNLMLGILPRLDGNLFPATVGAVDKKDPDSLLTLL
jgi:hypothetical protein